MQTVQNGHNFPSNATSSASKYFYCNQFWYVGYTTDGLRDKIIRLS